MSSAKVGAWSHAEDFITPSEHVVSARGRAAELGAKDIGNGAGATLQWLAAATGARAVMEIGTGTGVTGLWLLGGMPADGILTTIDPDTEHQRAARESFAEAGVAHTRTRVIAGRALDVLPRMTDGAYDLLVIDGEPQDYPEYWSQAMRLLRSGGTVAFAWSDRESDPAARDADTKAMREVSRLVRDSDYTVSLLPVSDGLLVAVKN